MGFDEAERLVGQQPRIVCANLRAQRLITGLRIHDISSLALNFKSESKIRDLNKVKANVLQMFYFTCITTVKSCIKSPDVRQLSALRTRRMRVKPRL